MTRITLTKLPTEAMAVTLTIGALEIDLHTLTAWVLDEQVTLTMNEVRLLMRLAAGWPLPVRHADLFLLLTGRPMSANVDLNSNTVPVHVARLRPKLPSPGLIGTERGGYTLTVRPTLTIHGCKITEHIA